jgi:hypothetical protein
LKMVVQASPFVAAAVIPYSTHHLLFLKTSAGEEFTVPAYLSDSARRSVYGRKRRAVLHTIAYCIVPAVDIVSFLRKCAPAVHGLDRMCTRGTHPILYTRTGVEEVIPHFKREALGWRWPTAEEYIFKLPIQAAPSVDSTSSLSVLAAAATATADADTSAAESFVQAPAEVDNVEAAPNCDVSATMYRESANTVSLPAGAGTSPLTPEATISAQLFHPVQYSPPSTTTTCATYTADVNAVLAATLQHAQSLPGCPWSMHPHQHSSFPSCTFGRFVAVDSRESSARLERGTALCVLFSAVDCPRPQ